MGITGTLLLKTEFLHTHTYYFSGSLALTICSKQFTHAFGQEYTSLFFLLATLQRGYQTEAHLERIVFDPLFASPTNRLANCWR